MRRLKRSGDEGIRLRCDELKKQERRDHHTPIPAPPAVLHDLYCIQENTTSCLQVEHGDLQTARWPG